MEDAKQPDSSLKRAFAIGMARQRQGDFDGAIRAWRAILLQNPDSVAALNNLGIALRRVGRIAESEAVLRTGIERHPMTAELHISLGQTRQEWGRDDEAEQEFIRASVLAPGAPAAHHALGALYLAQGRLEDGIRALSAAIRADAKHVPSLVGLAAALIDRGDATEAAGHLNTALALSPDHAEAHAALADLLLLAGDYEAGFREWRWKHGAPPEDAAEDGPAFEDGDLSGRPVTVDCDTDFGETFLLIRLLRKLTGGKVTVRCRPSLVTLLRGCGWLDSVVSRDDPTADEAETILPLSRIPGLINLQADSVPAAVPYLRPDPSSLAYWRSRLPPDGISIGVNWSGGDGDIPLAAFEPLARLPGVTLVSLQKGDARREIADCGFPVLDLGDEIDEAGGAFVDSAGLVSVLPLVVANQSPIVHLAGALDKTVWAVLPPTPHWCFGLEGDSTPWYSSAVLFRRDPRHSWTHTLSGAAQQISGLRDLTQTYRG